MAEKRDSPYIWVTWLAKIMSGDITCQWQGWFLTQNKLTKKQPNNFDLADWKINHTKMLTELKEKLIKDKYMPILEKPIKYNIPNSDAVICGKPDCVIENKDTVIVYDCKTGKERDSDQVQIKLYMYLLSKGEFSEKKIKGVVLYKDKEIEIKDLPENFEENFNFFVERLISAEPSTKNPGGDCRFCDIIKDDCPERV